MYYSLPVRLLPNSGPKGDQGDHAPDPVKISHQKVSWPLIQPPDPLLLLL